MIFLQDLLWAAISNFHLGPAEQQMELVAENDYPTNLNLFRWLRAEDNAFHEHCVQSLLLLRVLDEDFSASLKMDLLHDTIGQVSMAEPDYEGKTQPGSPGCDSLDEQTAHDASYAHRNTKFAANTAFSRADEILTASDQISCQQMTTSSIVWMRIER